MSTIMTYEFRENNIKNPTYECHYGRFALDFFQIEDTVFQKDIKIAMKSCLLSCLMCVST